jgi:hypothetical protein
MGVKVSDLTTESAPASSDILVIADPTTGLARKITVSALKTYMDSLGGGGDVTAPTVVSATVENADADTIVVVFSESVTGVSATGWSFKKNGSGWTISTVTGSGTTWSFNMATAAVNGDTLLRSYDSGTGATIDAAANELVSFTDSSVTNNVSAGSGYETESDTFFAANTGLSTPQKDALDALVVSMKSIGWAKFKAVYPFIGGSASAHKWNLINPVDTDGGFRGVFSGTVTHTANGIKGNATTGYMNTKLIPATDLSVNDAHFGIYINEAATSAQGRHGCDSSSGANNMLIAAGLAGSTYHRMWGTANDGTAVVTQADETDFFLVTRRSGTDMEAYKGSTSVQTNSGSTGVGGLPVARECYVLGFNEDGTANYFSDQRIAFVTIGSGLTDAEVTTYYNAIQTYQTALSRNV